MKPLLFVVGDSISMHYGPFLERFIAPRFSYGRKTGVEGNLDLPTGVEVANGGDSSMVLKYLQFQQERKFHAAVFLLNCGLHDIKSTARQNQVPLDQYEANLRAIIPLWRGMTDHPIWIRTTPVDDEQHNTRSSFHRYAADLERYNACADRVMRENAIPVIDLHAFAGTLEDPWQDHVHYKEPARVQQAAFIAGAVWSLVNEGESTGGEAA